MPNKQGNHAGPEVDLFPAAGIPRFKRFSGGSRRPQIPPHLPGFHPESSGFTRFSIFPIIFTYFHPFHIFSPISHIFTSPHLPPELPYFAYFTYFTIFTQFSHILHISHNFHPFHTFSPPPLLPPLGLGRGAGQKSKNSQYLADVRGFSPHLQNSVSAKTS